MIDLLRGRPGAVARNERLERTGMVSPVTIEEIWRGARGDEQPAIARLFDSLRTVPIDAAAGEQAGRWRGSFARRGVTLGQADCLIAATAHRAGAGIATGNPKDFPMEEVEVIHWPVGE